MCRVGWLTSFLILGMTPLLLAQNAPQTASPEEKACHALGDAFVKAFNQHDSASLAALWKEDAVYLSHSSRTQLTGRPEIESAYAQLFVSDPKIQIASRAQATAKAESGGITLSGILDEKHTDGTLSSSAFVAHCEQVDDKWLISRVEESELPVQLPVEVRLKKLDWFLGRWEEKHESQSIRSTILPAPGGNFLTRRYQRYQDNEPVQGGMQMFGWDQEQQCYRTWLFDEDGSFGEGTLTQTAADQWVMKIAMKLPDGQRGALTQTIKVVGTDSLEMQSIDQEINGSPLPNSPVAKLTRISDAADLTK